MRFLLLYFFFASTPSHAATDLNLARNACILGEDPGPCVGYYEELKDKQLLKFGSHRIFRQCRDKNKYCEYVEILCDMKDSAACGVLAASVRQNEVKFVPLAKKACELNDESSCRSLAEMYVMKGQRLKAVPYYAASCRLNGSGCLILGRWGVRGKIVPAERKLVEDICKEKKKEDPATAPGIKVQDGPQACSVLALPLEPVPYV